MQSTYFGIFFCRQFKDSQYIADTSILKALFEDDSNFEKVHVIFWIVYHTECEKILIIHIWKRCLFHIKNPYKSIIRSP